MSSILFASAKLISVKGLLTDYTTFFSGLMPGEIKARFPDLWLDDIDEGGKNINEEQLLIEQLKILSCSSDISFNKVFNVGHGKKMLEKLNEFLNKSLNVIIYKIINKLSY